MICFQYSQKGWQISIDYGLGLWLSHELSVLEAGLQETDLVCLANVSARMISERKNSNQG